MSTKGDICFFSSTGNSFAIARELADTLSCRIISIGINAAPDELRSGKGILGFVFPVYHATYGESGIPDIVREFIDSIGDLSSRYIFAVCTHGGIPGSTIEHTRRLIELHNGKLMAGVSVQMSTPVSIFQKISHMVTKKPLMPNPVTEEKKQLALFRNWEKKKAVLVSDIRENRIHIETLNPSREIVLQWLSGAQKGIVLKRYQGLAQSSSTDLHELFRSSDRSFRVNGNCNRCGTCAKVCPVSNISIGEKPTWNHRCALCYACYQWCPRQAIYGEIVEFERRHHHPGIALQDMINRKDLSVTST